MGARRQRHLLGAVGVDGVKALPPALEQKADQIDQHVGVARRGFHRWRVAEIGLHRMDLADAAERLQMVGQIGPAHRYPDKVVPLGQSTHHVAAEKARAAIDGDEGFSVASGGHRRSREQRGLQFGQYRIGRGLYRPANRPRRAAMRFN